jgi:hypothetical protein
MMTTDFTSTPPPATRLDPHKRINYSLGLVLGVDEFEQEQFYHLERGRQHNRALHGYGTVCGLQLTSSGSQVYVSPGLAIDPRGRVLEVDRVQCGDLNQWLAVPANLQAATGNVGSPMGSASVFVVLCYRECLTDNVPVPGAPCRSEQDTLAASRITEAFDLKFTTVLPAADEELAIRRFGELLRQIEVSSSGPPGQFLTPAGLEQLVRALEPAASPLVSPLFSPVGPPLLLHPQDAEAALRGAFRVWVTEVRPRLLSTGCGAPVEGCVLLGELDFGVTAAGHIAPQAAPQIAINEDERPYLVSTRLLQESRLAGIGEAVVSLTSPIGAPPIGVPPLTNLAGDAFGPVASTTVTGIQKVAVAAGTPANGDVLTYDAAASHWHPAPPPTGGPGVPNLAGDAFGPVASTTVTGIQNIPVVAAAPADQQVLTFDAAANHWHPAPLPPPPPPVLPALNGDAAGSITSNFVQRIQGIPVDHSPPNDGDLLTSVGSGINAVWHPVAPSFVQHPRGLLSYGIVAAGYVPIEAAPAPNATYPDLTARLFTGPLAQTGRVLIHFKSFDPAAHQYIVKVLPSLEFANVDGASFTPVVIFLGVNTATPPGPGLVLLVRDSNTGQQINDAVLTQIRLMVEISQFPMPAGV